MGKLTVILGVILLAVVGVGTYVLTDGFGTNDSTEQSSVGQSETNGDEQPTEQTASGTQEAAELIEQALSGGDAVECRFVQEEYPGTAYIESNSNFRVEAETEEGTGYMIKKGDVAYVWTDGSTTGFTFSGDSFDEQYDEQVDIFTPEELEELAADDEATRDIDCQVTAVDSSLFELPDGIEFQSMDELFQNIPAQ